MINRFPLKLMIDSRASSLGNSSAFSVSLPEMLHLPEDTAMYVNAASITNTFLSTGTHIGAKNHYFYWFEKLDGVDIVFNRCALPEQGYDAEELAGALQTAINAATWFGDGLYTCAYTPERQTILISRPNDGVRTFYVPTDTLMAMPAFQAQTNLRTVGSVAYSVDWNNLQSAFDLFGLGKGSSKTLDLSALLQLLAGPLYITQETGAIDVRHVHNVYVHSQSLSNHNVISAMSGSRTCIVKIPVSGQPGDVLHRAHNGNMYDYIDVSNKTISTLDFAIYDGRGFPLDLRGGTMSLEMLFVPRPI